MGKKKSKTKVEPWAPAQRYILDNLADTKATFDANQPKLQGYATAMQDTYGRVAPGAEAGITGAQGLVNDTLSGKYLDKGNPYLEGIISKSNRGIQDGVNGQFESAGRYGSGMHAGILADRIAENENDLRYGNYAQERQNQIGAIGQSQDLMSGASGLLNNAAQLPWLGVQAQNGGTTQLSSPYSTRTETQSGGLGQQLLGGAFTLGGAAISKYSEPYMKDVEDKVGETPDGLGLYSYTYKGDDTPQVGVMADEVEQVRPDAITPTPTGDRAVNYSKLGLPDPTEMAQIVPQALPKVTPPRPSFGEALVNPDTTTIGGALTNIGAGLLATSGGPIGEGIGRGLLGTWSKNRDDANDTEERNLRRGEVEARARYYQAQANKQAMPAAPRPPQLFQRRDGSIVSVDPNTGQGRPVDGLPALAAPPEALVATMDGYVPRSKAAGKMPYRAPERASSGGRASSPSKSPPKYAPGPGGAVMKWVP